MAIFLREQGEQCKFAQSLGKVDYIGIRSTTPKYKRSHF